MHLGRGGLAPSSEGEAPPARRLAAEGAKVAIFDMNAEKGEAVAKEIGGVFCQVNVSDEASIDAGLAKAREAHGQERVFVNCAGIGWAEKTARRSSSNREVSAYSAKGVLDCMGKAANQTASGFLGRCRASVLADGVEARGGPHLERGRRAPRREPGRPGVGALQVSARERAAPPVTTPKPLRRGRPALPAGPEWPPRASPRPPRARPTRARRG